MPKASAATSKASAPTPGSSSARCRSRRVDHIEGLSPAIAIEQKHMGHTPRSTVGTVTEIYDYLRILMARLGTAVLPRLRHADRHADRPTRSSTRSWPSRPGTKLYLMAPLEVDVGEKYETLWDEIRAAGYVRMRVDGQTYSRRRAAADRPPPQAPGRSGRSTASSIRPDARVADRRQRRKRACRWARACCTSPIRDDDVPEPNWRRRDPQPALRLRPAAAAASSR